MMCIEQVLLRNALQQFAFYDQRCLAQGKTGPVGDAEDVRVNGHCGLAEGGIEDDVGSLATYPRNCLQTLNPPVFLRDYFKSL